MWLLEQCRREWSAAGNDYSYPELIAAAEAAPAFRSIINPDSLSFANPLSMIDAIRRYCRTTGQVEPQ